MDDESFLKQWLISAEKGESIRELADRIGMEYQIVYRRFGKLGQKHQLPALFGQRIRMSKNDQRLSRLIAAWREKREAQLRKV